jgi:hypothetical protein
MRFGPFFVGVSLAATVGGFVIAVLASTVLNEHQTVYEAAASLFYVLAIVSPVVAVAVVTYGLLAAAIAGVLRRPVWWAGLLSGLIPALAIAVIFSLPGEETYHSYATADELLFASRVDSVASVLTVIWCAVSAAVLLPLTSQRSAAKVRTIVGKRLGKS